MRGTALLVVLLTVVGTATAADEIPADWQTAAERSGFRATGSYHETIEFLDRLDAASPFIRTGSFGLSGAGRPLPLVVVSHDPLFDPEGAAASGKPILLIQSCIHAGEVDGKDATLMLLRDWVVGRRPPPREAILLFLPILNADGHERVSPFNRPNQNGPVQGMGFRTTASGLDLNRDHLRLASPEMRALIRLFNEWRPHLHVDNHVTDGVDHAWVLTWAVAEAPQLAPEVDAWVRERLPRALAETAGRGHPNGPYVSLVDREDPTKGHEFGPGTPRYSTDFFPLRNRPSILVEMHAPKPYRLRVEANRDFLQALIDEVERAPQALVAAVRAAEQSTVAIGQADADPSQVVVTWRTSDQPTTVEWPASEWYSEPSVVTGGEVLLFRSGKIRQIAVPRFGRPEPDLTVARPRGYLVLPGWPQIEELVRGHGLRALRLAAEAEAEVETIRIAEPTFASTPFQGTLLVNDLSVGRTVERRTLPAGSLWIPADQPDFAVAVQLIEPEAPDSVVRWGLLNTVFERKEYIELRNLEVLVRETLTDPAVRAEWESALADEAFRADSVARALWWYRRTPYWDDQVGLMPVFRVMRTLEATFAP